MLVKGSLVTEMSGSLGGITAARNKGGLYFRARSATVNPNSPAQVAVRAQLQALSTAWTETLTEAQRDAWRTYAANVTTTNALGDAKTNSGQNWYVACNTPRVRAGLDRVDDAPAIFDRAQLNPVSIEVNGGTPPTLDVEVTFDDAQDWVNDPQSGLLVQVSRPQNQSLSFFKGPFRQAGTILGDGTTPPTPGAIILSPFEYAENQRVYARIRLTLADGRLSPPQIVSTIAVTP